MTAKHNLSAIICTIGFPDTNADKLQNIFNKYVAEKLKCDATTIEKSVTKLLDYSEPKPDGIFTTMFYLNSLNHIHQMPNQINALIDRYGEQNIIVILFKPKLSNVIHNLTYQLSEDKLYDRLKNLITLMDAAKEIIYEDISNDPIKDIDKVQMIHGTRKCPQIIYEYDPMSAVNIESIQTLKKLFLEPISKRATQLHELYQKAIKSAGFTLYTNYTTRPDESHYTNDPNPKLCSISDKTLTFKTISEIIMDFLIKQDLTLYAHFWLKEITQSIKDQIDHDTTLPVICMSKENVNNLFPTKDGLMNHQKAISGKTALLPDVKLITDFNQDNYKLLKLFTTILGDRKKDKELLAHIIYRCMLPGTDYSGKYVLIQYDGHTETECDLLKNTLMSLAHYKTIDINDRNDIHGINETIGYPVDATMILFPETNSRINPGKYADKQCCNHVYVQFNKTFPDALLEDDNVIPVKLQYIPQIKNHLNPLDQKQQFKKFLENVLSWCFNMYSSTNN